MPTKETTYAGMLGSWTKLLGSLAENAAELGHLEGSRAKLERLVTQAQDAARRQAAHTVAKQQATQEIQGLIVEGQRLVNLLRIAVKEHYGIRAEKLADFGLQPFRGRKTKPVFPEFPEKPPATTPTTT